MLQPHGPWRLLLLLLLFSLPCAFAAPAAPAVGWKALRGGRSDAEGAAVWALPSDDARRPVVRVTDVSEDPKPPAGEPDPTFQKLAMAAFAASLVALLLSVLAIGVLCRLLGAAKQIEMIDLARRGALATAAPNQAGEGAKPQSCSYHSYDQQAAKRASLKPPSPSPKENAQRRLSRHFEEFHGITPIDGGGTNASTDDIGGAPDFNGVWECVETWGLDDFLKALKVGKLRRVAASKAPWPTWQFSQAGQEFTYINKSKFGVMTEAFKADGSSYAHKDLEGNESTCKATVSGGTLKIERVGKQGKCIETRTQENDALNFVLEMEGVDFKWGRRFVRKPGSSKR